MPKLSPGGPGCPAEFSSNLPQHTCQEVSSMLRKSLIIWFRCLIGVGTLQDTGPPGLSLGTPDVGSRVRYTSLVEAWLSLTKPYCSD